jgi:hypothetical protein
MPAWEAPFHREVLLIVPDHLVNSSKFKGSKFKVKEQGGYARRELWRHLTGGYPPTKKPKTQNLKILPQLTK